MGRAVRLGVAAIALLAILLTAAAFLVPFDIYRKPLADAASRATGRQVTITGPLHLTLYPEIGISVTGVTLANVAGAREPNMVGVGELIVGAKLLPLLSGRLEVTRLVLEKPVIHLEIAADGRANWAFERAEQTPDAQSRQQGMSRLGLADVTINDGSLSFYDRRNGKTYALSDIDAGLSLTEAAGLKLSGALTYNKERLNLGAAFSTPMALAAGGTSKAGLNLKSDIVNGEFNGNLALVGRTEGALKLGARSMRRLLAWSGFPLPAGQGFELVALEAGIAKEGKTVTLSDLTMAFDGMSITGGLTLTQADRPSLSGKLAVDRMDLNPYLSAAPAAKAASAAPTPGWSAAPLSLGVLNMFEADLSLNVGQLRLRKLSFDRAYIDTVLRGGVLRANVRGVALYGGTGKGGLTVDASSSVPAVHMTLDVASVKVLPFMRDLIGVERIDGTGAVRFDVSARGGSQQAIMSGLNGKASLNFTDGSIKGVDLAAVSRVVQSVIAGQGLGNATGERAKTDYAELAASFAIANGVMKNDDFRLLNPFVRLTGDGEVNLAARMLDFHLEPRIVGNAQGQGGAHGAKGVGVPFRVHGPWTDLSYGPDTQRLGRSLLKSVTGEGGIGGLLGLGRSNSDGEKQPSAGDLLKGLFGGR